MASRSPQPISEAQLRERQQRILQIARASGFVGRVEYRHVYRQAGGAHYGRGSEQQGDLLTVYADAFQRAADPTDFSLKAIIAHECGHQILVRHPRIRRSVAGLPLTGEEIVASLLGAMLCDQERDQVSLFAKAAAELLGRGIRANAVNRQLQELWGVLVAML